MTDLQKRILDRIQTDFPLCRDPYAQLASELRCTAEDALAAVAGLRESGVIRRIGGVFASTHLGYVSCLVAVKVDQDCIEEAAARAGKYPEVTHNYERADEYNLWFTIVADSEQRLCGILEDVAACKGVHEVRRLPALKTFKIKVKFGFGEDNES